MLLLTIFFVPSILASNLINSNLETLTSSSISFSSHLLQKFEQHTIVIHTDNSSVFAVGDILAASPVLSTFYYHGSKKKIPRRPPGKTCVNLVALSDPRKISKYLQSYNNVRSDDVILFAVVDDSFQQAVLGIPGLSKFGRVLIFAYKESGVAAYTVCFYCGRSTELKFLYMLQYTNFNLSNFDLLPQIINDFHGHEFKISYVPYFPYIYCLRGNGKCVDALGMDFELLETLKRKLNFTYQLIEVPQGYEEMYQGLISNKFDLAIGGVTMTNGRRKILQFSSVIKFEPVAFYFVPKQVQPIIFFSSVSTDVKILLYLVIGFIIFFLYFTQSKLSLLSLCFMIQRTMFEQPIPRLNQRVSRNVRIVLASWWFLAMIVNIVLKSKLTATMVSNPERVVDPRELLNDGYKIVIDENIASTINDLSQFDKSTFIYINTKCNSFNYAKENKGMVIGELSRVELHNRLDCGDLDPNVRFSRLVLHLQPHAWPFKFRAPFVEAFNVYIERAMNGGLVHFWYNDVKFKNHMFLKTSSHTENKKIGVKEFVVHFVLFSVFQGASTLCFVAELLYYKYTEKKKNGPAHPPLLKLYT